MTIVVERTFSPVSGTPKTFTERDGCRGVRIDNSSECTLWVRLGGSDAPRSPASATLTVGPYAWWQGPINGGMVAIYPTTDPTQSGVASTQLGPLSPLAGQGSCQVTFYDTPIRPDSGQGASPPMGANPGQSFPWGRTGKSSIVSVAWPAFFASNYPGLRLTYWNHGTHPARIRLDITIADPAAVPTLIVYSHHLLIKGNGEGTTGAAGQVHICEIPIPYIPSNSASTRYVKVAPTMFKTTEGAGNDVGLMPVLLAGGLSDIGQPEYLPRSAYEYVQVPFNTCLGTNTSPFMSANLGSELYVYGADIRFPTAPAANSIVRLGITNNVLAVVQELAMCVVTAANFASAALQFGPVDFENAALCDDSAVSPGEALSITVDTASNVDFQGVVLLGP